MVELSNEIPISGVAITTTSEVEVHPLSLLKTVNWYVPPAFTFGLSVVPPLRIVPFVVVHS